MNPMPSQTHRGTLGQGFVKKLEKNFGHRTIENKVREFFLNNTNNYATQEICSIHSTDLLEASATYGNQGISSEPKTNQKQNWFLRVLRS